MQTYITRKSLSFGRGNAKLSKEIATFSLPAGYTCPGALQCLAFANRDTGTISDGSKQAFRCFAASAEAMYPSVRESRWANFEALKEAATREGMAELIIASIPKWAKAVRIHVSGDFFSAAYFLAWCDAAKAFPHLHFYAYTKSLNFWLKNAAQIPENLSLTASEGGKFDALIGERELKSAKVVFSEEQAAALGLAIDHDDSHAMHGADSFALLLHGGQRKGSEAAKAKQALKAHGFHGYSAK